MEAVSDPQAAYRAHGPALVRKAERMLRSREDAVDIGVAELLSLAFEAVESGDTDAAHRHRAVVRHIRHHLVILALGVEGDHLGVGRVGGHEFRP